MNDVVTGTILTGNRDFGIIGYGSSKYQRLPQHDEFTYLWEAAQRALESAGIGHREVDGVAISSTTLGGDNAVTFSEHAGIALSWAGGSVAGGAGGLACVADAMAAIAAGHATHVLCLASGRQTKDQFRDRVGAFNQSVALHLAPHGIGGMNGLFALIQRKHMLRFGTRPEELGRIAVGQRASAGLNPRALLRDPMAIEDYLSAPMVADPLRLFDCVMPCSGAEAVLIGPLDRVSRASQVRILASAERYNHRPGEAVPTSGGWQHFRDRFYASAGHGPDECQFLQCYDDYPIMAAIQIEDLGFCRKGEVGPFLAGHSLHWGGSFPVNTGGGQLSVGQAGGAGGMIGLVEAVQQLRGEAGLRQVENARRGVVSGYGMVAYGHGLAASALFLEGGNG